MATKVDLGVHAKLEVVQKDFKFDIVTDAKSVKLLANSKEQIFAEKMKSLLRLGTLSSRYKDVFDMYYLIGKMNRATLRDYFSLYPETPRTDGRRCPLASARASSCPGRHAIFKRQLRNKKFAWLNVAPEIATKAILDYVLTIR